MNTNERFDPIAAAKLGLSRMDLEMRAHYIGGSEANTIVTGTDWEIDNIIRVKRGEREPENLEDNKAVQAGTYNEPLVVKWFQDDTDLTVYARNETRQHPLFPHYRASVDGLVDHPEWGECVFEAKWTSQTNLETITKSYFGQLQSNMECCGAKKAFLAAGMGGTKFGFVDVDYDPEYVKAMRLRTELVWDAIQSDDGMLREPLPEMPKAKMPAIFIPSKPVDLTTVKEANRIAVLAPRFRENYGAAKEFAKVEKELKALTPKDSNSIGFGLKTTINAAGAKSIVPVNEKVEELS